MTARGPFVGAGAVLPGSAGRCSDSVEPAAGIRPGGQARAAASPTVPACRKILRRLWQAASRRHSPRAPASPRRQFAAVLAGHDLAEYGFDDGFAAAVGCAAG